MPPAYGDLCVTKYAFIPVLSVTQTFSGHLVSQTCPWVLKRYLLYKTESVLTAADMPLSYQFYYPAYMANALKRFFAAPMTRGKTNLGCSSGPWGGLFHPIWARRHYGCQAIIQALKPWSSQGGVPTSPGPYSTRKRQADLDNSISSTLGSCRGTPFVPDKGLLAEIN